jgi:hypothetical protein
MKGYVYVFRMIGTDFYKIGMTNSDSIKNRLEGFKTYAPNGVEVTQVIKTENARDLEKQLHKKFQFKRLKGEFFNLDKNDLDYLESLQESKIIDLKNFFWTYIFENDFDIDSVKRMFIIKNEVSPIEDSSDNQVIDYIYQNLKGNQLTCSEIRKLILNDLRIDINTKNLGVMLKKNFVQKMKKIEGVNQRVYLL